MKNLFGFLLITFLTVALSAFAGEPTKQSTVTVQSVQVVQVVSVTNLLDLSTVSLSPDKGVQVSITASTEIAKITAKKWQKLWEPIQDEYGYTMYYAEYQMVWIGYPVYQEVKDYTGTCKSLNGTTWNCSI